MLMFTASQAVAFARRIDILIYHSYTSLTVSVLIKDVDKVLYSRFKAQAVLQGIKVGQALSLAMEKWLNNSISESAEEQVRTKNNATFRRLYPELIDEHENKWILISEGTMLGLFDTMMEGAHMIKSQNLYGKPNILTQLSKKSRKVTLGLRRRREN